MPAYTITLTDAEDKALRHVALDPQEWIDNAVHNRCRQAIDAIYTAEVERMTNDPDIASIPADKTQVVLDADIMSAADMQAHNELNDPPEAPA